MRSLIEHRPRLAVPAAIAAVLAALLVALPVQADEAEIAAIEKSITGLENQIKNASMRLKHVTGTAEPGAASNLGNQSERKPAALFLKCCNKNLDVMRDRLAEISASVRLLYERHAATEDEAALNAVAGMADGAEIVGKNLDHMRRSGDRNFARAALGSLGAAVRTLRERTEAYVECCAPGAKPAGGKVKPKQGDAS